MNHAYWKQSLCKAIYGVQYYQFHDKNQICVNFSKVHFIIPIFVTRRNVVLQLTRDEIKVAEMFGRRQWSKINRYVFNTT